MKQINRMKKQRRNWTDCGSHLCQEKRENHGRCARDLQQGNRLSGGGIEVAGKRLPRSAENQSTNNTLAGDDVELDRRRVRRRVCILQNALIVLWLLTLVSHHEFEETGHVCPVAPALRGTA